MRMSVVLFECGVLVLGVLLVQSGLTANGDEGKSPKMTSTETPVTPTPSNKNTTDNVGANGGKQGSDVIRIRRSTDGHLGVDELLKDPKVAKVAKLLKYHGIDTPKLLKSGAPKNLTDVLVPVITTNPTIHKFSEVLKTQGVDLLEVLKPPGHSDDEFTEEAKQDSYSDWAVEEALKRLAEHGYSVEDLQRISGFKPLPVPGNALQLLEYNRDVLAGIYNERSPSGSLPSGRFKEDTSEEELIDIDLQIALDILDRLGYTYEYLMTISGDMDDPDCTEILVILKTCGYGVEQFRPLYYGGTAIDLLDYNTEVLGRNKGNYCLLGKGLSKEDRSEEEEKEVDPDAQEILDILYRHGYTYEHLMTISGDMNDPVCMEVLNILKSCGYEVELFRPLDYSGTVLNLMGYNIEVLRRNENNLCVTSNGFRTYPDWDVSEENLTIDKEPQFPPPPPKPLSYRLSKEDPSEEDSPNNIFDTVMVQVLEILYQNGYGLLKLMTIPADFANPQCTEVLEILRTHGYQVDRFTPLPGTGMLLQLLLENRDILAENHLPQSSSGDQPSDCISEDNSTPLPPPGPSEDDPKMHFDPPAISEDSAVGPLCPTNQYLKSIFGDYGYAGHLDHIMSTFGTCGVPSYLYNLIHFLKSHLWSYYEKFYQNVMRHLSLLEGIPCPDLLSLKTIVSEPLQFLTEYGPQLEDKINSMVSMGQCS